MLFPLAKVWWRCKRQSSWQLWRLGCMRPWISLEDSWVEDHGLFLPFKSMAIAKSSSWRSWFLDFICALYVFCSVSRKYMVLEDCLLLNPPTLWPIDVQESSWVQSLAQWLWLQGRGVEVDAIAVQSVLTSCRRPGAFTGDLGLQCNICNICI